PQHYCCDLAAYPPTLIGKTNHRTGRSRRWCTWHYSTQGLPTTPVTRNDRELLPHVFTLILFYQDGYFLWHYLLLAFTSSRLLTGVLPFAVRTFLPPETEER